MRNRSRHRHGSRIDRRSYSPTADWIIQPLREAFPYDTAPRYLIFDNDSIFNRAVVGFVKSMGTKPSRTAYFSPWQHPVAERWIGSCRRELLSHVVVLGQQPRGATRVPSEMSWLTLLYVFDRETVVPH